MSARLPAPVSPAFPLILLKMWGELVNNSKKFRTFAAARLRERAAPQPLDIPKGVACYRRDARIQVNLIAFGLHRPCKQIYTRNDDERVKQY